ncbi:MAG: acetate/propionate family kinase [Gemmataceae bacterium]|nr:acetate/propionate family kinase [Gemmataceae bacterium]
MRVLVVNAGSTNVKLSVLDGDREAVAVVNRLPAAAVAAGLDQLRAKGLLPVEAVGHRFVHGGEAFTEGVRITHEVVATLADLNDLAPLHNPPALEALVEAHKQLPDVPHVAAFDTAFHHGIPPQAYKYPVPRPWTERWGIRKFGFHGLSHEYCARRAAELLGPVGDPVLRLVIAHLGGGCSLAAVWGGIGIDTTMGFTPMDGLMMGSRCGAVDPGVLLHVMRKHGLTGDDVDKALNRESGLLGVSGVAADFRKVRAAADRGDQRALLACEMFAYRVRLGIGAMAAALDGADAVVFTAGIGENSAWLRTEVCKHLDFLGVKLDRERNETARPDADVSAAGSRCRVLVVHAREDVTIAREVERVLAEPSPGG